MVSHSRGDEGKTTLYPLNEVGMHIHGEPCWVTAADELTMARTIPILEHCRSKVGFVTLAQIPFIAKRMSRRLQTTESKPATVPPTSGKVSIGSGATRGFCSRQNIRSVVSRRASRIRACYEAQLASNPRLAGKLVITWTISMTGHVTSAQITKSTLANERVSGCILRTVRRMRFEKPKGGICIVRWPFVFKAQ